MSFAKVSRTRVLVRRSEARCGIIQKAGTMLVRFVDQSLKA
jgi:hypothetical protein